MSGNMALKASTDLSYQAEKDHDGYITLKADKVKDDEETTTYLKLEKVIYGDGNRDHSCIVVASEKTAKPVQLPLIEQQMLEVLPIEGGLTFTDWLNAVVAALERGRTRITAKTTHKAIRYILRA
jgi:hypothetical protein